MTIRRLPRASLGHSSHRSTPAPIHTRVSNSEKRRRRERFFRSCRAGAETRTVLGKVALGFRGLGMMVTADADTASFTHPGANPNSPCYCAASLPGRRGPYRTVVGSDFPQPRRPVPGEPPETLIPCCRPASYDGKTTEVLYRADFGACLRSTRPLTPAVPTTFLKSLGRQRTGRDGANVNRIFLRPGNYGAVGRLWRRDWAGIEAAANSFAKTVAQTIQSFTCGVEQSPKAFGVSLL